jgi:Flp pilus assembly protein TadB
MLWIVAAGLLFIWFLLKVLLHKGGFVHILLLGGISLLIIQFAAYRKARYQRISAGR